jgi:hypothetical protein
VPDIYLHAKLGSGIKLAPNAGNTPVGQSVSAPVASFTFTARTPVLEQRPPNLVSVGYGIDIWLNERTPSVASGVPLAITPPAASFAFTAQTPTVNQVSTDNLVQAPLRSFSFTPRTPGVASGWLPVLPGVAGFGFTAQAPAITTQAATGNIVAPLTFFPFATRTPLVAQQDTAIRPGYARFDFAPLAPLTNGNFVVIAPAASFAFTARQPVVPDKPLPKVRAPRGDGVSARSSNLSTTTR